MVKMVYFTFLNHNLEKGEKKTGNQKYQNQTELSDHTQSLDTAPEFVFADLEFLLLQVAVFNR